MWSIWNIPNEHPERKSYYDNNRFKEEIPAIKNVNFECCNFRVEIDDDVNSSIQEFEKCNGNRMSIHVYGIHKDIKKHCDGSLVGEYVNNIDESRQLNNIDKHDKLLITEDDSDKHRFSQCI